jgi:type III restriction enzyme
MCAPSLHDLLNEEKFREELPLFAGLGMLEGKAPEAQSIVDKKLLDALPERLRKAADESISLFGFFEKKQGVNYAPVFTALLGVIDETAKGLVLQKLTPKMPPNMQDQRDWFEPHFGAVEHTKRRHYEEVARSLRKTLVYKNGVSPLGLLRNCLDYALNDNTRLTGVFEAVKAELKFAGGRDLLDRVKTINEFRNTRVAHQEQPLTNPAEAKTALVVWVDGLNRLWQAGKLQSATVTQAFKEHDIVSLVAALPAEGLAAGAGGTVVHLYADGRACEVEFVTPQGSKVVTLSLNQIKPTI